MRHAAFAAAVALAGCAAPRLPPVTDGQFTRDEDEAYLWREADDLEHGIDRSGALDPEPGLERYLTGVARRLVPRRAQERLKIRVRAYDDPDFNAFALPNGGMYVSSGLLARFENEAQLATVIAHEIMHAVNRHAIVEYRTFKNGAAVSASIPGARMLGLGSLGTKAAVTGYSRDNEREADAEGLALVAAARYDVRQAPRVFEILAAFLAEQKLDDEPFFFGRHPKLQERTESMRALVAGLYAGKAGGDVGADRYRSAVREVLPRNGRLALAAGWFGAAEHDARSYLELRPGSADGWVLLGEATRQAGGPDADARALAHLRKAVALDAGCAEAQRALGRLLARQGDRVGARAALRAYLKARPGAEDRAFVEDDLAELEGRKP